MKSTRHRISRARGIFTQALIVRQRRQRSDPWKSICGVQLANRGIVEAEVELAVGRAVRAVRKDSRR